MATQLDLRKLALERPERDRPRHSRKRSFLTRYVIPGAIGLGFLAMVGWAVRDHIWARKPVTVVPVIITRAEVQQVGTPLFQAAGWIEPRPTPVSVAALTEGIVKELLVVEGQSVAAGTPVARLIDVDAKLGLRETEIALALKQAELRSAQAARKAARLRIEHPVHLESALADAEARLAQAKTELAKMPFLIESAQGRLKYAHSNLAGKQAAGSAISGRLVQQAESELADIDAELKELEQREPHLRQELESLGKKCAALTKQRELLIEESRELQDAEAKVTAAEARRDQAQLAVEKAKLQLERTVVRSPVDGRVMQLIAQPGARVMGMEASAQLNSSTVVTLYDPQMLQVRADVRLEDVPLVQPGQTVEIETASSQEKIHGTVLMATSTANIQKNTLEVKIAIEQPPLTVRPEMLVTATFLAPRRSEAQDTESQELERLLVPKQLVESADGQSAIWLVDASGIARRRPIRTSQAGTPELVEIVEGLNATDKLIAGGREGLHEGDRVVIVGEDGTVGIAASDP